MQEPSDGYLGQYAGNQDDRETADLENLCAELHRRITGFLDSEISDELLKRVQSQTRASLGVAEEAITKYRCV